MNSSAESELSRHRSLFVADIIYLVYGAKVGDQYGMNCHNRVVTKDGKNKGRYFFSCSLPIGFANDPKARCNFFQWDDVK